jgi:hypothetical protein
VASLQWLTPRHNAHRHQGRNKSLSLLTRAVMNRKVGVARFGFPVFTVRRQPGSPKPAPVEASKAGFEATLSKKFGPPRSLSHLSQRGWRF